MVTPSGTRARGSLEKSFLLLRECPNHSWQEVFGYRSLLQGPLQEVSKRRAYPSLPISSDCSWLSEVSIAWVFSLWWCCENNFLFWRAFSLFSPHGNFWKFVKTHTRTQTSQAIHKLSRWVGTNGSLSKKCTQDNRTVVIIWGFYTQSAAGHTALAFSLFFSCTQWDKAGLGQEESRCLLN